MKKFSLNIPKEIPNRLRWKLNGDKNGLVLENSKMGIVAEYGLVYDVDDKPSHCQVRIVIKAPSAVVVPFMETDTGLLFGVLKGVYRSPANEVFDEFPRGFSDFIKDEKRFETSKEAAIRELSEIDEGGLFLPQDRFNFLGGPYNMDTAWLEYPNEGGISVFSSKIMSEEKNNTLALIGKEKYFKLTFLPKEEIHFHCGISQLALMTFLVKYYNLI